MDLFAIVRELCNNYPDFVEAIDYSIDRGEKFIVIYRGFKSDNLYYYLSKISIISDREFCIPIHEVEAILIKLGAYAI